jgi:hypothetical protein
MANTVLEEIRRQSVWCGEFGSPFTAQLLGRLADNIEAGGIVARLTEGWAGNPRADAVSLRIAGALHAAALTGRDAALAGVYPDRDAAWTMDRVWPVAEAFLTRDEAWVRAFMMSPPQTNETARSAGLAAGFMWLMQEDSPEPFHMLEIGASAGLNLNWDKFGYAYAPWGRTGGSPLIPTKVLGEPPAWRDIAISDRAACDQNPLDASNPDDRLRLRAYVWADQTHRMERLNGAIELARASGLKVDRRDAAEWLREKLGGELKAGTTVVYHSVFFQYPPLEVRAAITEAIEQAGAGATRERRLAWVRFEPEAILGAERESTRYVLNVVTWDGSRQERTLADCDPHGRTLEWVG